MQLYDYRWFLYKQLLSFSLIDNVFFTDISDVEVISNPFPHLRSDMLYCGDERGTLSQCGWLNPARKNPVLIEGLDEFRDIMNSDKPLLNAGILGGNSIVVLDFLSTFCNIISAVAARPVEHTADMAIFNYAIYYYNFDVIHGHPVNSVFRGGLNETDVWFRHK